MSIPFRSEHAGHFRLDGVCLCPWLPRRLGPHDSYLTLLLRLYHLVICPPKHTQTEKLPRPKALPWFPTTYLNNRTPRLRLGHASSPAIVCWCPSSSLGCSLCGQAASSPTRTCPSLFCLPSWLLTVSMWKENPFGFPEFLLAQWLVQSFHMPQDSPAAPQVPSDLSGSKHSGDYCHCF